MHPVPLLPHPGRRAGQARHAVNAAEAAALRAADEQLAASVAAVAQAVAGHVAGQQRAEVVAVEAAPQRVGNTVGAAGLGAPGKGERGLDIMGCICLHLKSARRGRG